MWESVFTVSVFPQHVLLVGPGVACVAWRFWLGELSDKGAAGEGGRGQRNREEIGAGAT